MWSESDSDDDGYQISPEMKELESLRGNPLLISGYTERIGFRCFQLSSCDASSKKFNTISYLRAVLSQGTGNAYTLQSQKFLMQAHSELDNNEMTSVALKSFPPYRGKRLSYYVGDYVPLTCSTRRNVMHCSADKSIDHHRVLSVSVGGHAENVSWEGQYLLRVDYGCLMLRMHKFHPELSPDVVQRIKRKRLNQNVQNELEKNLDEYQLSRQVVMMLKLSSIKKVYLCKLEASAEEENMKSAKDAKKGYRAAEEAGLKSSSEESEDSHCDSDGNEIPTAPNSVVFLVIEVTETPVFGHKYTCTNNHGLNKWKKCGDAFQGKPTLTKPFHVILGSADCSDFKHLVLEMIAEYPPLKVMYEQCETVPLKPGWKSALQTGPPTSGCEEPPRAPKYAEDRPVTPAAKMIQHEQVKKLMMAFVGGFKLEEEIEADGGIGDLIDHRAAGDYEMNNNVDADGKVTDKTSEDEMSGCSNDDNNSDSSSEESEEDENAGDGSGAADRSDIVVTPRVAQLRKDILEVLVRYDLLTKSRADKILNKPKNMEGSDHLQKARVNNYLGGLKFHSCFVDYLNFKCSDIEDLEYHLKVRLDKDIGYDVYDCVESLGIDEGVVEFEELVTVRDLLKYGQCDSSGGDYAYYSFCWEFIKDNNHDEHCDLCHSCYDWHFWHCFNCGRCSYGQSIPKCEHCGIRDISGHKRQPVLKTDFMSCVIRGSKLYSLFEVTRNFMSQMMDF